MIDLATFFNNARNTNLCERGAKIWENCKSKKQLIDFALGSWGMEYVATAIAQGWGIEPEAISVEFSPFINGKYIRNADGYTSAIYCQPEDKDVTINTTSALIVAFNGTIIIPQNRICELHVVNSNIKIVGEGRGTVYLYNSDLINPDSAPIIIKQNVNYGI